MNRTAASSPSRPVSSPKKPFAIGHGDRAAVRLFFRDDTLLKVFHRSVARAHNDFLERAHRAKSTNTIDIEPLAHVRSMTCLTGCVKR
jgi:hypothetical protein